MKAVQKLLGHTSIQTTGDVYADWDVDQLAATMADVLSEEDECGVCRSFPPWEPKVETAGIEPASAVACKVASTSVAGALISPPTSLAGGVVEGQLQTKSSVWLERASPSKPTV